MAEPPSSPVKDTKLFKGIFAVAGIMSTLVIYGVLQVSGPPFYASKIVKIGYYLFNLSRCNAYVYAEGVC